MQEVKKIEVRFLKALYPYREGDVGMMRENLAKGQFADSVEILDAKTAKNAPKNDVPEAGDAEVAADAKSIEAAPSDKSMASRTSKKSK